MAGQNRRWPVFLVSMAATIRGGLGNWSWLNPNNLRTGFAAGNENSFKTNLSQFCFLINHLPLLFIIKQFLYEQV